VSLPSAAGAWPRRARIALVLALTLGGEWPAAGPPSEQRAVPVDDLSALEPIGAVAPPPHGSVAQRCPRDVPVAFIGADILTMNSTTLQRGQTVLVRAGRVADIGSPRLPADACRVDARGKVLLPALADLHAHVTERDLPLFLANGVTLVREMNGSPVHLALRRRIERGDVLGPRLLVASTLLSGAPLRYRHRLITSVDDAYAAAHEAKDAGYDFLKVYDDLTPDQYRALVEAGRTLGLRLDGHVPREVGLAAVLDAGQAIQHLDKIASALAGHALDSARLADAGRMFAGRSVWVTPTLASLRALDLAGTQEYVGRLRRPEMAYVDSSTLVWWHTLVRGGTRAYAPSRFYHFQTALLKVLKESGGVRFLLGTDAANPLMVAGFSVHDELEALVRDGGFSAYEALLAATRNVADFLGDSTGGRVAVGARADLVLVDASPLTDLATLRQPHGVMVAGRWLERPPLGRTP
jgi:imidazolonepropionase-like amidohydrolase